MEAAAAPARNASLIGPSALDILLAVPRLANLGIEAMDNIAGKIFNGGSVIADATAKHTTANATITSAGALAAQSSAALEAAWRDAWTDGSGESSSLFMTVVHGIGKLKNFGGIFSYLTSRWAITTFAVAVILNRTHFYASSREHLRLKFPVRLALYAIPIAAFLTQALGILQSLKCQTSPQFAQYRYGDPLKHLSIDFAGEGGFLYWLSSTLLFWQDDASCCAARNMSLAAGEETVVLRGSMSIIYRFFLTLCAGQLFETLACALQGRQIMPETGLTIFEHSLAFAECEAMMSSALGFGFFGLPKMDGTEPGDRSGPLITRSEMLPRLNVPPEVLLVCLISSFSHLSSAFLAVIGIRKRVRLVNTAIWACCYMSAFFWSFNKVLSSPLSNITDLGVLRFPTVCIIGFIPHFIIILGIIICAIIYAMAIIITAVSVPSEVAQGMSVRQRLGWAYNNLQANVQFSQNSSIRIKMSEDFYTTLLKIGFNILTAASEAVYLNEGSQVQVAQMTWVEQKRLDELTSSMGKRRRPTIPTELLGEGIARGVGFIDQQNSAISAQSPYARERKSKPMRKDGHKPSASEMDSGLGLMQRRSRMQLTMDFLWGILWLEVNVLAQIFIGALRKLGIEWRPSWLLKAAGLDQDEPAPPADLVPSRPDTLDFYMIDAEGNSTLPSDRNVDVEVEMRRRQKHKGTYENEENLGDNIYSWWRRGGWFGDVDNSGEYQARDLDDDVTSMISMSTNASTSDELSDGQRTPTQRSPFGSRETTPVPEAEHGFDLSSLARLLNPKTIADRDEARLLAHSLQSSRPMTRSAYRRTLDRGRAELLTGLRSPQPPVHQSEEDEERDLEQFLLSQRAAKAHLRTGSGVGGSWESGAEGMGASGPQCVVCQCSPRTVLVWPCGCLSMCDDCRLGLATRNYTKCICCRTDIAAYSRLYVP